MGSNASWEALDSNASVLVRRTVLSGPADTPEAERFLALDLVVLAAAVQPAPGRAHRGRRPSYVVTVRPEQVVEIAFDGVQRSSRYPGGMALRFPGCFAIRATRLPPMPTRSASSGSFSTLPAPPTTRPEPPYNASSSEPYSRTAIRKAA